MQLCQTEGTLVLPTHLLPHLLQARGLILHILGQQDEHAEVLVLKGKLYDFTVDTVNVAHAEHGFQTHHLHWLGVRLEEEKKPGLLAFSFTHVYMEIYILFSPIKDNDLSFYMYRYI